MYREVENKGLKRTSEERYDTNERGTEVERGRRKERMRREVERRKKGCGQEVVRDVS